MTEPKNVTPEGTIPEGAQPPPDIGGDASSTMRGPDVWTAGWDRRRGGFPLLGVLLVLIGVALLVQYLVPQVRVGTLILLAIGVAFLAAWLVGRSWFSMVPGFLVLALGIAELLKDLAVFALPQQAQSGLSATALAIGFLVIWVVARLGNRHWMWPLWAAAIFGIIGVAQLSTFVTLPQFGAVIPALLIILGIVVLFNWRRERA